jgi:hypothetical protein
VAVWFACRGTKGDGNETASVFGLPNRVGIATGAPILLPHPYIRRLYRQRGVFVYPQSSMVLRQLCVEVRFPPDPNFKVVRDNLTVPELLPVDEWWDMLTDLARRIVRNGISQKLKDLEEGGWEIFSFLIDECELTDPEEQMLLNPKFMYMQAKREQLMDSTSDLLQMLLCMTTAMWDNNTPRVSKTAMRHCVAVSGSTLSAMLPLLRAYLNHLPQVALLREAGEAMFSQLIHELRLQNFAVLEDGWTPV